MKNDYYLLITVLESNQTYIGIDIYKLLSFAYAICIFIILPKI